MTHPEVIKRIGWLLPVFNGLLILYLCFTVPSSCKQKKEKELDQPPSLYLPPITVALNTDSGYTINQVTGDSVKPIENSLVKTGIIIPANMKIIDSNLSKPKIIQASWKLVDTVTSNIHQLPQNLKTKPADLSKFRKFIIGKDTSSFVLKGYKQQIIPTGTPITVANKTVPCKLPRATESLPMSIYQYSNYDFKYLDTYHGLKYQNVYCVTEDRTGNLWICSIEGPSYYNGKTFLHFTEQNGLINNRAYFVLEDRKGNIWFDHGAGEISCYDGSKFIQYDFDNTTGRSLVGDNTMFEDSKGNIWFTNTVLGVTRFEGKNFTHFTKKEGLNSTEITCISEDSQGNIWFGSKDSGAYRFDYNSFTYFNKESGLNHNGIHSIFEDRDKAIWFSTEEGLTKFDGKNFISITDKDGLSSNSVGTINQDSSGAIWVSTYGYGLNKITEKTITHFTEKEGLLSNFIWDMIPAKNGGRWIATTKGVVFFDDSGFVHKSLANSIPSHLTAIAKDDSGAFFLGATSGLYKFDEKSISKLVDKDSGTYTFIRNLLIDKKGNLWIGTMGNGLLHFDGKHLKYLTQRDGLPNHYINSILEDSRGNIWVGTHKGIAMYNGQNFFQFAEKQKLSDEFIMAIFEDKQNNIWIGSRNGGLTKYDGNSFIHYSEKEGLGSNYVKSIAADRDGFIWLSSQFSVTGFYGKSFTIIGEKAGLPKRFVNSVFCDSNNNLWVSNHNQLMQIPSKYISLRDEDKQEQRGGIIDHDKLQRLGLQFVFYSLDKHNRLWMLENHKASTTMIDLSKYKKIDAPPVVTLYNIDINNRPIDYRDLVESEIKKISFSGIRRFSNVPFNLKVPYNYNQFTFHFYATSGASVNNIRYSHKIEELANDWSEPSSEGTAYYQYLPPGIYTFKVRAMDKSMLWGEPLIYQFTIMAPFWQRWWFYTLCGVLVSCIIIFIIKKRTNSILRKQRERVESERKIVELEAKSKQAILNERLRISTELHDEIGATLSGIAMYSHLSKEQMKTGQHADIERSLNIMQQSSSEMVNKLNDIVWLINPEKDTLKKLIERLEEYARDMAAIKSMKVKIVMPASFHEKILPVEVRRNIYLFCKEAINNAVKYSGGDQLELIIKETDGKLEFTVNDNGRGFDEVMVRRGNGLENMQKRADEIGAQLSLQSKLNEGVKVSMQYKIT